MWPNFVRYKDIIWFRAVAGLKSEARKNYLGYIWFVLEPIITTSVLYFTISQFSSKRGPEVVFSLLLAMILWQWFEGSVMLSAHSIKAKFHVHMQVSLPKYLFPLVDILSNTIKFSFAFVLLLIASLFFGAGIGASWAWIPLLLAVQLVLIIGVALILSISVSLIPDMLVPVASFFRLLFFASGIFFAADRIPAAVLPYFYANPMAVLIEAYRAVILHHHAPDIARLNVALLTAVGFLAVGLLVQSFFDKRLLKLINV